jgi:hypothetical protein
LVGDDERSRDFVGGVVEPPGLVRGVFTRSSGMAGRIYGVVSGGKLRADSCEGAAGFDSSPIAAPHMAKLMSAAATAAAKPITERRHIGFTVLGLQPRPEHMLAEAPVRHVDIPRQRFGRNKAEELR